MENAKPFYDLCINAKMGTNFDEIAKKCVEFGYKTIAIDHIHDLTGLGAKDVRRKKKYDQSKAGNEQSACYIPSPIQYKSKDPDLTILHRLTIVSTDKDVCFNVMKHENFHKYHIFAVNAKNTETFHFVCDNVDADIISFDPLDIKGIKMSRKSYKKAVRRGLHFEIMYFPALVDQNSRKNIITKSHMYHQVGKSENIIITSGCTSVLTLRGPYDVINLGLVFGLSEQKAKRSISSAGADVLKHSMARKIGKAIVYISNKSKDNKRKETPMEVDSDETKAQPVQKKLKTNENDVILLDP